jgi:hypothetical protein
MTPTDKFINTFKGLLIIDRDDLDEELVRHPELLHQVSEKLAEAIDQRDTAKEHLEEVDAGLLFTVQVKLEKRSQRITDKVVSAKTLLDATHQKAARKYGRAKHRANRLQLLKDDFERRGYAIRDMVQLYIGGYYADKPVREPRGPEAEVINRANRRRIANKRKARKNTDA